jgi:conjugal transfer mating pair stabilization protein TraG
MSSYKGKDDCTDTILDMIAEKESHGNYNAVIGHINGYHGKDITDMTIRQIYSLMDEVLYKHTPRMPSTAMGRYQIIRKTMKSLAEILKLNVDRDKFTPVLQDRMAVELLKVRNYQKWWLKKMGTIDFAHHLSKEWASLPDPYKGGRSHYDGIAGNHAGMSLAHVYATLDKARSLMPTDGR